MSPIHNMLSLTIVIPALSISRSLLSSFRLSPSVKSAGHATEILGTLRDTRLFLVTLSSPPIPWSAAGGGGLGKQAGRAASCRSPFAVLCHQAEVGIVRAGSLRPGLTRMCPWGIWRRRRVSCDTQSGGALSLFHLYLSLCVCWRSAGN